MYCQKCGKKQNDDAIFCYSCGAKMVIPKLDDNDTPDNDVPQRKHYEEKDPFDVWDAEGMKKPIRKNKNRRKMGKSNNYDDRYDDERHGCGTTILVVVIIIVVLSITGSLVRLIIGDKYNTSNSSTGIITGVDAFNSSYSSNMSEHNYISRKCMAEGCTKEGLYSIKGITGNTEYYCYSHLQGIKSLLDYMLDD